MSFLFQGSGETHRAEQRETFTHCGSTHTPSRGIPFRPRAIMDGRRVDYLHQTTQSALPRDFSNREANGREFDDLGASTQNTEDRPR